MEERSEEAGPSRTPPRGGADTASRPARRLPRLAPDATLLSTLQANARAYYLSRDLVRIDEGGLNLSQKRQRSRRGHTERGRRDLGLPLGDGGLRQLRGWGVRAGLTNGEGRQTLEPEVDSGVPESAKPGRHVRHTSSVNMHRACEGSALVAAAIFLEEHVASLLPSLSSPDSLSPSLTEASPKDERVSLLSEVLPAPSRRVIETLQARNDAAIRERGDGQEGRKKRGREDEDANLGWAWASRKRGPTGSRRQPSQGDAEVRQDGGNDPQQGS